MNGSVFQLTNPRSWGLRWAHIRATAVSRPLLFVVAFLVVTLVMLWPLPLHAASSVQDLGDPLYEIWTMRWVQHQLIHDPTHLWNGNTGYPFTDSLLFSEPRISTSVIAWPVQLLSGNDVLTYNFMLMASYVLVGTGMALVIWEITGEFGAAILTGFVSAFAPFRYGHLSHLNLLSYGWSLLALWAMIRFARRRSAVDASLAALFLVIQVLASDTLGVMAGVLITAAIVVVLWQERSRLTWRFGTGLASIVLIPAIAELPVALARLHVDQTYGFSRDLDTVSRMSATLQSYVSVSPGNHFWHAIGLLPTAYPNPLFPGVLAGVAAIVGFAFAARRWAAWTICGASIAFIGFVLSLGPYATVDGIRYHLPYYLLYQFVPGFDAMRDAARFGMLALIGLEILAGLGVAAMWRLARSRLPQARAGLIGAVLLLLLVSVAAIELKTSVGTATVPTDPTSVAVDDWLARQPDGPVIEFPANGLWANIGWTTREIYASTRHWHPIIAAYTSFLPQRDIDMLVAIHGGTNTPSLVSGANVGLLQDLKIRYVVIHHWAGYDWQQALSEAAKLPELTRVGDIGDATVFTLAPGSRIPVTYRIVAPGDAEAGKSFVADIMTINDNQTGAISWLHLDPTASVTWQSQDGQVISAGTYPFHLGVTANPGLTHHPIAPTAPNEPGVYQLSIYCPALHQRLEQSVTVTRQERSDTTLGTPIVLKQLAIPPGPYRPGDRIVVVAVWEVRQRLSRNLTATLQILNEQNKPVGQWDGLPLGPDVQTSQWAVGSIVAEPILVTVPPDMYALKVRLMLALYDESSPSLKRQSIQRPDGSSGLQYFSHPIQIQSDGS